MDRLYLVNYAQVEVPYFEQVQVQVFIEIILHFQDVIVLVSEVDLLSILNYNEIEIDYYSVEANFAKD